MFLRFLFLLLTVAAAQAQSAAPAVPPASDAKADINYTDAVVLGLVEGVTEYLPVSSTGHLIIANDWLGLEVETPLFDADGAPVALKDHGQTRQMTLKDAADSYAIIIQFGAIAAVMILYWRRLWTVALGALGRDRRGFRLLCNLVVAFLPAAVLGLLLRKYIEQYLFSIWTVVAALAAGSVLMFCVEAWRKRNCPPPDRDVGPDLPELPLASAFMIGLLQCVAMWPGTSRSMMTLVGGYLAGLNPKRAAEFSFLLGFVTLSAASLYKLAKNGREILSALDAGPLALGLILATISAAISVKWLVGYLTRHGLGLFAWYRLALAGLLCALALL